MQLGFLPVYAGSFTAVLKPAKRIVGTIVAADTGKPLAGIDVYAYGTPSTYPYSGFIEPVDTHRISDGAGRFAFPDMPKPLYRVFASV